MADSTVCVALLQDVSGARPPIRSPWRQSARMLPTTLARSWTPERLHVPLFRHLSPNVPAAAAVAPPRRRSHPAVYMLAGAFLLVAAVVGATLYIERAGATPPVDEDTRSPVPAAEASVPPSTSGSSTVTPAVTTATPNGKTQPLVPPAGGVNATGEGRPPSRPAAVGRTAVTDAASREERPPEASAQTRPAEPEPTPPAVGKPAADLEQLEDGDRPAVGAGGRREQQPQPSAAGAGPAGSRPPCRHGGPPGKHEAQSVQGGCKRLASATRPERSGTRDSPRPTWKRSSGSSAASDLLVPKVDRHALALREAVQHALEGKFAADPALLEAAVGMPRGLTQALVDLNPA